MATDDNSNFQEDEVFVAILIDDEAVVELEDGGDVVVELRDSSVTTFAVDESLYPVVALISDSEESQYIIDEEDSAELLDLGSVVVDNFQERRQQKFIAQSRSKKQWIAITISISLLIVALAMLALESPIYDVDEVKLENDSTLALTEPEQTEILKSLETLKGQQMYRVNADGTIKKISAISTISEVKISKSWHGTIKAVIKRRVPIAFIETDKVIVRVLE